VYHIVPDPATLAQVAALPEDAVRRWTFGAGQAGQVIYLIIEPQQEVHLLLVQWWA